MALGGDGPDLVPGAVPNSTGATLAAEQRHQVPCAGIEKAGPDTEATLKDYGTLPVEDSGHGYGLHTVTSWGVFDTPLATSGMRR